jgi:5-methyltetrahydrofolate--homocysteine methyltransferase
MDSLNERTLAQTLQDSVSVSEGVTRESDVIAHSEVTLSEAQHSETQHAGSSADENAQLGANAIPAIDAQDVTAPFWGTKIVTASLDDLLKHLDLKTMLSAKWGLRATNGIAQLIAAQQERIDAAIERARDLVNPCAVYGYFRVSAHGNALSVIDESGGEVAQFDFPRQRRAPYTCLSDYFVTADKDVPAVLPLQLVTIGDEFAPGLRELFLGDRYRDYLELHGLGMQLAEAFADLLHERIRAELSVPKTQGRRFSFGYPACPDLSQRATLFELLDASRVRVSLTETFQLDPEASTDALIVAHSQARHFSIR